MDKYMAAVAPGSYLGLSHGTDENLPPAQTEATAETDGSRGFYYGVARRGRTA